MTSSLMFVGVICALVAVTMANVGQRFIGHAVSDEYPGQCYYKDENVPIKIGASYLSKKECTEVQCQDEFVLRIIGCPAYGQVRPECKTIQDKNALFPKCCLTLMCP